MTSNKKASDYQKVSGGFIRGAKICENLLLFSTF